MSTVPSMTTNGLRAQALGLASGGLMMTGFGLAWWGIASQAVEYRSQLPYWGVIDLVALALVGGSLALLRSARRLRQDTSHESVARGQAIGQHFRQRFQLVFGLEVVVVATVDLVLHRVHHAEWFFPLLAIIVGLHFLPLAHLFHVRGYYATGLLLCMAGLIVLAATPSTAMMGRARVWNTLPGLLCGAILWLTAIYVLLQGKHLLVQVREGLANRSPHLRAHEDRRAGTETVTVTQSVWISPNREQRHEP